MMHTQSITDYENWRDRLHDLPEPDRELPDEQITQQYSHDYPNDTTLTYSRSGSQVEMKLSFTSEDPDMGTEEMLYNGQAGESLDTLVTELRKGISAFLDHADGYVRSDPQAIQSSDDYYADFSRTALFAFEGALKEMEKEKELPLKCQPIQTEKMDWLYSDSDKDAQRGCVGHLRGDFGSSGKELWTTWFDHQPKLKKPAFQQELQTLVNELRKPDSLLHDFSTLNRQCHQGTQLRGSYGFHAESSQYEYCLRCSPIKGDYHFYLYCYDKAAQREHAQPSVADQLRAKPATGSQTPDHKINRTNEKER